MERAELVSAAAAVAGRVVEVLSGVRVRDEVPAETWAALYECRDRLVAALDARPASPVDAAAGRPDQMAWPVADFAGQLTRFLALWRERIPAPDMVRGKAQRDLDGLVRAAQSVTLAAR